MDDSSGDAINFLQELVGLELSAVVFVRDYVQLQLATVGGPIRAVASVISTPTLVAADVRATWGGPGFRDLLCAQISHGISFVDYAADEYAMIGFDTGCNMRIPLVPERPTDAECLIVNVGKETLGLVALHTDCSESGVAGLGFVPADRLAIGSSIVTRAGPTAAVSAIAWQHETTGAPFQVYNFEVESDHTYFVGKADGGVWGL